MIRRIFKTWRWSWKKPSYQQLNKYTPSNIAYYNIFLTAILGSDPFHTKFCDESHFISKDLQREKVLGPINIRQHVITNDLQGNLTSLLINPLIFNVALGVHYSVTLLTSIHPEQHPVVLDIREDSNAAFDFFRFILFCLSNGHLVAGDFLIMDNASVHVSQEILEVLLVVCDIFKVTVRVLPTYSPELNPCEMAFNLVKKMLREYRGDDVFWVEIIKAFSKVTHDFLFLEYLRCRSFTPLVHPMAVVV